MTSSLDIFQLRLERHFRGLASERKEVGYPIFALEHGLSHVEVLSLEDALRKEFLADGLSERHWLVWVVYAAEQGYNYDGAEYWHSFEERTKSWGQQGDRQKIRSWFIKFRTTYFGARPTGTWASHFSIISWPITHAVLPHDLQGQLARSLYNARHRLGDVKSLTAKNVGKLIATSSHDPSSRFRFFLDQEEFVGQIVLALLDHNIGSVSPLLPLTLERIVSDLNKVRTARDWLHDARQAQSTPQFRLPVPRGKGGQDEEEDHAHEADKPLNDVCLGKQVLLRPAFSVRRQLHDIWSIDISIPSFQPLANLSTENSSFIRNTRLTIPCTGTSRLPAGWLLSGLRQRQISSWPNDGECLVQFENTPTPFDEALKTECQLVPGPVWLFRLNQDGTGQQIPGRTLRPEQRYLLVSRHPISLAEYAQNCSISCNNLYGTILTAPKQIDAALCTLLKAIELDVSRSITIKPVGFIPRQWDGEGLGEWLTNEQPCFVITRDHNFDSYELKLDGAERLVINCNANSEPAFVNLGLLETGRHTLSIQTKLSARVVAEKTLTFFVRQPNIWIPGTLNHTGMLVDMTPNEPSIDNFLDGDMELEILGNSSRIAKCSLVLVDSLGKELERHVVFEHRFPITRSIWSKALTIFLSKERDEFQYLRASSAYILIDGEDLGEYRIPLTRNHGPLRWFFQNRKEDMYLRLINDGDDEGLITSFYDFRRPLDKTVLNSSDCIHGIKISEPGGLFIAEKEGIKHSVVIAPIKVTGGLGGLQCGIDSDALDASTDVASLLSARVMWQEVSLSGVLAGNRRNRAIAAVEDRIFALLCGGDWISLERKVRENSRNMAAWERLEAAVCKQISFPIALAKVWHDNVAGDEEYLKKRFVEISAKFKICRDERLVKSAWIIAFDPYDFIAKSNNEISERLELLEENTTLVRGARLLFLCRKFRSVMTENHS